MSPHRGDDGDEDQAAHSCQSNGAHNFGALFSGLLGALGGLEDTLCVVQRRQARRCTLPPSQIFKTSASRNTTG
jgi:hypothetical protein